MPGLGGTQHSIARPSINVNNFEIKLALLQMLRSIIQFYSLTNEDLNNHIAEFLKIYYMFKSNGVTEDALKLRLFPFTLKDKVKMWLKSQPPSSFTIWDDLSKAFIAKYFPSKMAKVLKKITSF